MSHLNVRFREAVFGQYCAKPPVRPNACKRYGVTGGEETIVTVGTVEKRGCLRPRPFAFGIGQDLCLMQREFVGDFIVARLRSNSAKLKALPPGSFYTEPSNRSHFAETRDEAVIVQITGVGPSSTRYIARGPHQGSRNWASRWLA